jgi:AraC-like DNA-binding protein
MSTANELILVMLRYLQTAGDSLRGLAREAGIPVERLDERRPELSPSQAARLWRLVQDRVRPSAGFSQQVGEMIARQLESGRARAAVIAEQLNMSRQTLYKRLKQENQSFAALLDQVRREQALFYLHDPQRTLTEVAQRLGFSELSAFSRAFKRWMGQSPAHYRAQALKFA